MDAEEVDMPAWLDAAFCQEMLRAAEDDAELAVDAVDVRPGVGKGENFGSHMHKATVAITKAGKREQRHIMVKSLPDGEAFLKLIMESRIFEQETRVYSHLLPTFKRLQESNGTPVTPLGCIYYPTRRPHTIVMEDLSQRGYRVADRHRRLDLAHAALTVRALARFHALSLGALRDEPALKQDFPDVFLAVEKRAENHHFQDRNVLGLAAEIATWPGFEGYADRLKRSNVIDKTVDVFAGESKFKVLCHGDCWVNNMMFRYDANGAPEDVLFVDFQICRYISLTYDLHYFVHSSVRDEVRTDHWHDLIADYHACLLSTLRSIRYDVTDVFTLTELRQELAATAVIGLFTSLLVLPVALADVHQAPDFTRMDAFDPDASAPKTEQVCVMVPAYSGLRFRAAMQSMLPEFARDGVL